MKPAVISTPLRVAANQQLEIQAEKRDIVGILEQLFVWKVIELQDKYLAYVNERFQNHTPRLIARKKLARRLLFDKSANDDHERFILTKLKKQCGGQFTSKMEMMKVQHELLSVYENQLLEKEHSGCHALLRDDKVEDLSRMF
ncbi:hypothetical protein K1719_039402 [Acacia pycnantha]|nr:hypothetical protein K1719_039402 [Acacia pycnantha]